MRLIALFTLLVLLPAAPPAWSGESSPSPKIPAHSKAAMQKILDANLAAQDQNHSLPPLPSTEETEALLDPIHEFYFRLWTLDPSFPDVFIKERRETQRMVMESFAADLMQQGTYERFTNAYVDVSNLHHYILESNPDSAVVKISGMLTVIVSGFEEDWDEDNQFSLSKEDGAWKISAMKEGGPRYR